MLVAAAVSIVTEQLRVPYTIALVVAGLVIGNMHLAPPIPVTPEILLTLLIPPLLFEGGLRLPPRHLKTYWGLIGLLAIPGTLLTALALGWIVSVLFHVDLRSALLLGAIISATDPVSVQALLREARLDLRLGTVLNGEAVLNDGVAIILFMIVGAGATVGLFDATLRFLWLLGGGVAIGGIVAAATAYALSRRNARSWRCSAASSRRSARCSSRAARGERCDRRGRGGRRVRQLRAAPLDRRRARDRETIWDMIAFLANSVLFLLIGIDVPADCSAATGR